jgi:hypothetical protein
MKKHGPGLVRIVFGPLSNLVENPPLAIDSHRNNFTVRPNILLWFSDSIDGILLSSDFR